MKAAVAPKEKLLRGAIRLTPALLMPIAPGAAFRVYALWVTFTALASITGGFVLAFYLLWTVGILLEGTGHDTELIGDSTYDIPPLYWPFGPKQRRIRRARRIRAIERELGLEAYPLG